jgi:hypothetical protein
MGSAQKRITGDVQRDVNSISGVTQVRIFVTNFAAFIIDISGDSWGGFLAKYIGCENNQKNNQ